MIFADHNTVRLTATELNDLRQANAKNGFAVNRIVTRDDLLEAVLGGLSLELQNDLMDFLETGNSPLTSGSGQLQSD